MEKKERKIILGANWQMRKGFKEGIEWIKKAGELVPSSDKVETIVFPQYPLIYEAVRVQGSNLRVGAQHVHYEEEGNSTGEVSANLIAEIGGKYSLIGHGERWKMYGESHNECNKQVLKLLKVGMIPILNIGEEVTKEDENLFKTVIENELGTELNGVSKEDLSKVVLSLEPSFHFSKGGCDDLESIEKYCKLVRNIVAEKFGDDVAKKMRILYSISTNPENFKARLSLPDVDGSLVGRSSLELDSFIKMTKIAEEFA